MDTHGVTLGEFVYFIIFTINLLKRSKFYIGFGETHNARITILEPYEKLTVKHEFIIQLLDIEGCYSLLDL
jgi:hypothetical protein